MSEYLIKEETLDAIAKQSMTLAGKSEAVSTADIIADLTDANAEIETQSELLSQLKGLVDRKTRSLDELIIERSIYGDLRLDGVTSIISRAFYACKALTTVDLPMVTSIGTEAFTKCTNLKYVVIRTASVATFRASFPSNIILYVPKNLVNDYAEYNNSLGVSSMPNMRVFPLEDYTVDGTITGELNKNKIHELT